VPASCVGSGLAQQVILASGSLHGIHNHLADFDGELIRRSRYATTRFRRALDATHFTTQSMNLLHSTLDLARSWALNKMLST
jgi:hypothetical protein